MQYIHTNIIAEFAFHLQDGTEYYKPVPVRYSYGYQPAESETRYYPGCAESIEITMAKLDSEYKNDYSLNEKKELREWFGGEEFKEQVWKWMQEQREKSMAY